MKKISYLVVLVGLSGLLFQCEAPCTRTVSQARINAVNQTKLQQDIDAIDAYLANNNITAIKDPTGMRYTIDVEGTGAMPCLENNIRITYTGRVMGSSNPFETQTTPVSFSLSGLILGWQIVMPKVKAGSTVTLYIPSGFAYGSSGNSVIPPNANLIFQISLIK